MPPIKFSNSWTDVFHRCVGRQSAASKYHRHLINTDSGQELDICEDNACYGDKLSPICLSDSAYFSGDESAVDASTLANDANSESSADIPSNDQPIFDISHHTGHYEGITCDVYRRTSIQDRSLRITRQRHKKVAMRKKAAVLENEANPMRMCEDCADTVITPPNISDTSTVSRTTSVQMRSWEIRRRRKDLLHQRRSKGYHGAPNCDVIPSSSTELPFPIVIHN